MIYVFIFEWLEYFNDNEMIYVGNVMYMKCVFIIDNDI